MLDNPRFILLIVALFLLTALMYYDRKNITRVSIIFFRRTKKGLDLIDRIAKAAPRFWNIYGWTGLVVGIISIFVSIALIGYGIYDLTDGGEQGGVGLVLPGLSGEASFQPGAFFIPIEYWIISIGIIMFVHELSHGIVARTEDFEINSVGWLVLGIIPGAFVEPKGENMLPGEESEETDNDEEHHGPWDQGNWKSQLKVLSAGSWANYLTAALFFMLFFGAATAFIGNELIYEAQEGSPAAEAGLTTGIIYSINNVSVEDDPNAFTREVLSIEAGDEVTVHTSEGTFTIIADKLEDDDELPPVQEDQLNELGVEERGFIGLEFQEQVIKEAYQEHAGFLMWFIMLLQMIFALNLAIGLFNMLPIKPLDGGQTVDVVVREFISDEATTYVNYFSLLGWIIVIGSVVFGLVFL